MAILSREFIFPSDLKLMERVPSLSEAFYSPPLISLAQDCIGLLKYSIRLLLLLCPDVLSPGLRIGEATIKIRIAKELVSQNLTSMLDNGC